MGFKIWVIENLAYRDLFLRFAIAQYYFYHSASHHSRPIARHMQVLQNRLTIPFGYSV